MLDLVIKLEGSVKQNNLPEFKKEALAMVKAANIPLVTDNDFARAKKTVKSCKEAEEAIALAKHNALRDTADVKSLFESLDEVSVELRTTRLALDKQVKKEEAGRKKRLVDSYCDDLKRVIGDLKLSPSHASIDRSIFELSIKGKSSEEKMKEALADILNEETGKIVALSENIEICRSIIAESEEQNPGLLPDTEVLVLEQPQALSVIIESRVAKFELAEIKKKEKEIADQKKAEEARKAAEVAVKKQTETVDQQTPPKQTTEPAISDTVNYSPVDSTFVLTIDMYCKVEEAKEITRIVNGHIGNNDAVKNINLSRG